MPKPQSDERPYHHGDLRRAIVKAALEILHETQSLEFSLRELARRAGVSHNAPYKHFAEKRELLAAVSAAGFETLTKRMAREMAGLSEPRQQLFAMLRAYIDHGVENPALYSLMFGRHLSGPDHSRPAIELAEAEKTKALLAGVIIAGGLGRTIPDAPRNERKIAGAILTCWSLVHGLTLLLADGLVGPKKKSGALADTLVQGMLEGLAAELPALPPGTWVGPQGPHHETDCST
ncbi:MAG TPA: TetR/AcrR family transcriptional regulator [Candidatus Limnocylindria bacterium]|nr:TetR/AcrR family transcriptional regulator [Candidatus Limnocylindria bacterium]